MTDIIIPVFEEKHGEGIPSRAVDFISFIQSKIADIPDEYRSAATLTFYSSYSYDDDDYNHSPVTLSIEYSRPMTAEEEKAHGVEEARKKDDEAFNAQWIENLRSAGYSNWEIRSGGMNEYYRPDRYRREVGP